MSTSMKKVHRIKRHSRIRAKVSGTAERPRVCVFKSNRRVFVQAIDDATHTTLASNALSAKAGKGTKTEQAKTVGSAIAKTLKDKGIAKAVFDTGGFKYHGRVKAVAEGLREGGIAM